MNPFLADLIACLRFYARIPIPWVARSAYAEPPNFKRAARAVGAAGAAIGTLPALALLATLRIGLPASLASFVALAALILATGALHEDGLADVADGFGAEVSRARKLEIMRDSRIGAFGAIALVLSLAWRWRAVALLAGASPWSAAAACIGAAASSRAIGLFPMARLDPARPDGLGAAFGKPSAFSFAAALATGSLIAFLPAATGLGLLRPAVGLAAAAACSWAITRLSAAQIGGFTGDVAGAAQQVAEIAYLTALCAGLR